MSEPPVASPTSEARQAAARLTRYVEWNDGFWLAYVFTIDATQAELVRARVREALAARDAELRLLRPSTPEQLRLEAVLERPEAGCIWVEAIREPEAGGGAWAGAWMQLILRGNERRELLRERLRGGLVLVMHPALKPDVRAAGPDLWSIRSVVFELPAGAPRVAPGPRLPLDAVTPLRFVDTELLDRDLARWSSASHETPAAQRAQSLLELGERLRAAHRHEQAAALSTEALTLCRELAHDDADSHRPLLVRALVGHATDLAALGREQELGELVDETVGLGRGNPELVGDDGSLLASALLRIASLASELGLYEQAELALREAADMLPPILAASQDERATQMARALHALTLNKLGWVLFLEDRVAEAADMADEALGLARVLVESNTATSVALLVSISNYSSIYLHALGRHEQALAAIGEAVERSRELAGVDAEHGLPYLAGSLYNRGLALGWLGRQSEAGDAMREAVAILRALEKEHPGRYQRELARALHNLARQSIFDEQWQEMSQTARDAVELRRTLVERGDEASRRELAQSLAVLAKAQEQLGDPASAFENLAEALRVLGPDRGSDEPLAVGLTAALVNCCETNELEIPADLASLVDL